jgi:NADH-quinone oxidoreductase subunit G
MDKKYMLINGRETPYTDEENILAVIRGAGIELSTFCYYSGLSVSTPAACASWRTRA